MATKGRKSAKVAAPETDQEILDTTLELAEEMGWEQVRLRLVAERLKRPLSEVLGHYRDLDAVADAWFGRALAAMLAPPPEGFETLPARERLHLILMRWFDALEPHRRVTGQMLSTKLYPSHPHHWVPMVFNLSRTIQWLRDAAMLDAGGLRRQIEEVGLTALFLATLAHWLRDESQNQERTRDFLARNLGLADSAIARFVQASPRSKGAA